MRASTPANGAAETAAPPAGRRAPARAPGAPRARAGPRRRGRCGPRRRRSRPGRPSGARYAGPRRPRQTMGGTRMDAVNHQVRLAARPVGLCKPSDWELTEEAVAEPGDGEVLVRVDYLSLDPAMRGWMNDAPLLHPAGRDRRGHARAAASGEVIASNSRGFSAGDHVTGDDRGPGVRGARTAAQLIKVDTSLAPLPVYLGTLGMPGLTAYFGLLDIGRPERGRHRGRLRRRRRGRQRRRPDRQDQGLPRGRHRGRPGEVPARRGGAGLRRGDRLQVRDVAPALRPSTARTGSTCTSTTSAARSSTPRCPLARRARVVICGAISQYNATGARCAGRPTTCRCSSIARR